MVEKKKEYSAIDAQPVVLYALQEISSQIAYPLVASPRSQTPTGSAIQVQIGPGDIISNLPVIISYDHHQIHEGETWRWSYYVPSLGINGIKDIRLSVPTSSTPLLSAVVWCPHMRFEVVASDLATINLWEGVTATTAGTERLPINLERNGTYTPKLKIFEDTVAPTSSTMIWQGVVFGTKSVAGDIDGSQNEFVLKAGTDYLMRVTSGAAANKVLSRFVWYEDLGV